MVPSHIRNKVWQNHLDVSRVYRYYDALFWRYSIFRNVFRAMLGASGIGAIASLLDFIPNTDVLVGISGALLGVLVILDFIIDPSEKAVVLGVASRNMSRYESQSRTLWESIDMRDVDYNTVLSKSTEILNTAIEDVNSVVSISTHGRLNERCAEETYTVESERYAT